MNRLSEFKRLSKSVLKAKDYTGSTVIFQNPAVLDEVYDRLSSTDQVYLFGVKDTPQIEKDIIRRLADTENFVFHTLDRMARGGRAIDSEIINPLTGRLMTGSSSGGVFNILEGINDLAIGTDGGGSVLGPALATSLFSIMGKGLGLKGKKPRESTDNISFIPAVGFISYDYKICLAAVKSVLGLDDLPVLENTPTIGIPRSGTLILPDGEDAVEVLKPVLETDALKGFSFVEVDFTGSHERKKALEIARNSFQDGIDILITAEGPVDYFGYGDSVIGQWKIGRQSQERSGKYLIRAANMVGATAVTIPTDRLATGVVFTARPGMATGLLVLSLAGMVADRYERPSLFYDYFINQQQNRNEGFFNE